MHGIASDRRTGTSTHTGAAGALLLALAAWTAGAQDVALSGGPARLHGDPGRHSSGLSSTPLAGAVAWPMQGHDGRRTGIGEVAGPTEPRLRWFRDLVNPTWGTKARTQDNGNPVVGPDGTVYLSTGESFFALNPDGTTKWTSLKGRNTGSAPAVSLTRGVVYLLDLGGDGPELFALSTANGSVVWSVLLDVFGAFFSYSSLAIGADETIYVGFGSVQSGDLFPAVAAVNPNGTLRWKFVDLQSHKNTAIETPPAVAPDGTVYVVENVRGLVAISPTGQFLWSGSFGGGYAWPTPAVGLDGTIYLAGETGVAFGAADTAAIAFRPDGSVRWRRDDLGAADFFAGVAISSDGTKVYRPGMSGSLHALDAATGATIWETHLDSWHGGLGGSPLLGSNGLLYVHCTYGHLHAFDARTGSESWHYQLNSGAFYWGTQSPALGPDGTVYAVAPGLPRALGDLAARVYAFHPTLGCVTTISPAIVGLPPAGGTGSVAVASGCAWTAVSSVPSWLTITGGSSGTGNGTVAYSVSANAGVGRTGLLSIGGQSFVVKQLGPVTDLGASLIGTSDGSAAWGDYDGDGDLDLLVVGWDGRVSKEVAKVYRNDGASGFIDIGAPLTAVYRGTAAWGDCDNDGDLDIVLTGSAGFGYALEVYRNDGGVFSKVWTGTRGFSWASSVAWGDIDNDGKLDILFHGGITALFHNDGNGSFTRSLPDLPYVEDGSVAFGDYDRDGDLDILLVGRAGSQRIAKVYRNDGGGAFTDAGASLTGVDHGSVAWGDLDNDGASDILLAGNDGTQRIAKVYRNNGGGLFTDTGASLTGVDDASVAWGDLDNDGDLDILLTGNIGSGPVSRVYRNTGGAFADVGFPLDGVDSGSAAWGDFDNDGDLDILLNGGLSAVTKVYRNESSVRNTVPGPPGELLASAGTGTVTLGWTAPTDAQTPGAGLTYNLRVGTTPGGVDVVAPMASTTSGLRRVPARGNATGGTSAILRPLPAGTYYWSVQAIDTAFAGSPFAAEASFLVQPSSWPLSVTRTGNGSGTVTSSPAGIACGSTCSASFGTGTTVTLSSSAANGSTFTGWSGEGCAGTGTCQVSMTQARDLTAGYQAGCGLPPAPITAPAAVCAGSTGGAASVADSGPGVTYAWTVTNGAITGGAGTATITFRPGGSSPVTLAVSVISAAGCSPTSSVTVVVTPLPLALVSGGGALCAGQSATVSAILTGQPPWTVAWSDGVTQSNVAVSPVTRTVSPSSTTVYAVSALDDAACTAEAAGLTGGATFTVLSAVPPPAIGAPSGLEAYARNVAASVVDHPGSSYQWTIAGGKLVSGQQTSQIVFDAGPAGTLSLSVVETTADGCTSPAATLAIAVLADPRKLYLHEGALSVGVRWRNQYSGETGLATASPEGTQYGYFYFFEPSNLEVFVKVLDWGAETPYLLFWASLTDFEYTITFTNQATGRSLEFLKPAGTLDGGKDTEHLPHGIAFGGLWSRDGATWSPLEEGESLASARTRSPGLSAWGLVEVPAVPAGAAISRTSVQAAPPAGPENELLLQGGVIGASVTWRNPYSGAAGAGVPIPKQGSFGYFYFFEATNPEVFVKVLDWGADRPYLLFWAGLTDFEYTVTFRNVLTGQSVSRTKVAGPISGGVDTTSLPHAP